MEERSGRELLRGRDADAVQEACVFRRRLGFGLPVGRGTRFLALVERMGNKEHAAAGGAPEVHHDMPAAGETNFENSIRHLSAITGKRHSSVTHGSVISRVRRATKVQFTRLVPATYRANSTMPNGHFVLNSTSLKPCLVIIFSISAISTGTNAERFSYPVSVIKIMSSRRIPRCSSAICIAGSMVNT